MSKKYTETKRFKKLSEEYLKNDDEFANIQKQLADLRASHKELVEAAKELEHLHECELEGLSSGQPTKEQWIKAVNELSEALSRAEAILNKDKER